MTRVPLARIREQAETWRLAEQGMGEVVAVANAEGVQLTEDMPVTWKASLAVDLEQGRRLEVECARSVPTGAREHLT